MTSKVNLAERARRMILGGNPSADAQVQMPELIQAIPPILGVALKNSWFTQKAEGEASVNGDYIYAFYSQPLIFDSAVQMYYVAMPSSYIDLPNHSGLTMVARMQSQDMPFVPVPPTFLALTRGLTIRELQNREPYFVENAKIFLPTLSSSDKDCVFLVKLALGLDDFDEDENLNIPVDVQDFVVSQLVQKFSYEQAAPHDVVNDNLKMNPGTPQQTAK